ncbi:MAG TPA: tetratricopeptide repeat protein [Candidatus Obscuribacterales bacterium]
MHDQNNFRELIRTAVRCAGACLLFLPLYACSIGNALQDGIQTTQKQETIQHDSPQDNLKLGMRYQKMGRVELSRAALLRAIEQDPEGKIGAAARSFLRARIPVKTVAVEAEQRNIVGVNQRINGEWKAARKTFSDLIRDYPDFEWAYGNFALLAIDENKLDEAQQLLQRALKINPNYANGWIYMGQVMRALKRQAEADACEKKARQLTSF